MPQTAEANHVPGRRTKAMEFNAAKVKQYAQTASTEELMDRVTVWRSGMEPQAVRIFESELARRGVGQLQIDAHAQQRQAAILAPDGMAVKCSFCERPAVVQAWGWHRMWKVLPVFPRLLAYCQEHRPKGKQQA
jgi:hypothetical protein